MDENMLALINSSQTLRSVPRDTNTMISSYTNLFTNQTGLLVSEQSPGKFRPPFNVYGAVIT